LFQGLKHLKLKWELDDPANSLTRIQNLPSLSPVTAKVLSNVGRVLELASKPCRLHRRFFRFISTVVNELELGASHLDNILTMAEIYLKMQLTNPP
jgi:hypothetical protein